MSRTLRDLLNLGDEPEDLYAMAMDLRSHADGSGGGLPAETLEAMAERLRARLQKWGKDRCASENHFRHFLEAVLLECGSEPIRFAGQASDTTDTSDDDTMTRMVEAAGGCASVRGWGLTRSALRIIIQAAITAGNLVPERTWLTRDHLVAERDAYAADVQRHERAMAVLRDEVGAPSSDPRDVVEATVRALRAARHAHIPAWLDVLHPAPGTGGDVDGGAA